MTTKKVTKKTTAKKTTAKKATTKKATTKKVVAAPATPVQAPQEEGGFFSKLFSWLN